MEKENNRRSFLKGCGLATIPLILPTVGLTATSLANASTVRSVSKEQAVNFIFDGLAFSPDEYLDKLIEITKQSTIEPDFYGQEGSIRLLEENFAKITGKEKAVYLPTGTMANQVAIKLLNGMNTKVIVPENSHIFRDEADAAQSVHSKRLVPIGKGEPYFSLNDLKDKINYTNESEVFKSGLGTVVIESPVRRADGVAVPVESIKEISAYCKQHGYKMHLDGARLHLAAAYTGVSISAYASYFDTVYISLYKYLNATGGAILCGDAKMIDQVAHQVKILGGTVYQNWSSSAMALHYLKGFKERWKKVRTVSDKLINALNKLEGIQIKSIKNGTNIYDLSLGKEVNLKTLAIYLYENHNIWLGRANDKGIVKFTINESILSRDIHTIIAAWEAGVQKARG